MKHNHLVTCYRAIVRQGTTCRGLKVARSEFKAARHATTRKLGNIPYIDEIEADFFEVLDTDTNWGRNELVDQLQIVINKTNTGVF